MLGPARSWTAEYLCALCRIQQPADDVSKVVALRRLQIKEPSLLGPHLLIWPTGRSKLIAEVVSKMLDLWAIGCQLYRCEMLLFDARDHAPQCLLVIGVRQAIMEDSKALMLPQINKDPGACAPPWWDHQAALHVHSFKAKLDKATLQVPLLSALR